MFILSFKRKLIIPSVNKKKNYSAKDILLYNDKESEIWGKILIIVEVRGGSPNSLIWAVQLVL